MSEVLVVVDVQKDFVDGSLAVPGARQIIPNINAMIQNFSARGKRVIFTIDYHKKNHPSFKEQGGLWPPHCVAGTEGSKFDDYLIVPEGYVTIVPKGYNIEEYSADLWDHIDDRRATVVGLATDYCVNATCKHLLSAGVKHLTVMGDCTAAVGNQQEALSALAKMGCEIKNLDF